MDNPPVVTGPIIVNLDEDSAIRWVSPTTNTFDPDVSDLVLPIWIPQALPPGVTYDTTFNYFIIDPAHPAYQMLAAGQQVTYVIEFGVTDQSSVMPHALVLTVTGVNDAANIQGSVFGFVTEDDPYVASGRLFAGDVDTGEAAFRTDGTPISGQYGSLTLSADGYWSYVLDSRLAAVQALNAGETLTDVIAVYSLDGTRKDLTITIHGADEPVIRGTEGADSLTGTAEAELILGLGGADRIWGRAGADTIDGGTGADSLYGEDGDDVLLFDITDKVQSAGLGNDTLRVAGAVTVNLAASDQISGDKGIASGFENVDASLSSLAVVLAGSAGGNILTGGAAADRLSGGRGADLLSGGAGADRFVFASTLDSAGSAIDRILDMVAGQDRIDLSAIDARAGGSNNAFTFIGGAAFSANGQLRYDAASGVLEADVTGDRVADLSIRLQAGLSLAAADFVL